MTDKENNTCFEEILHNQGKLVYTNTGTSMMPLLRQHRDGKVIPLRTRGEYGSVPLLYRMYVFLWCVFFPVRAVILYLKYKLTCIL